MEVKWWKKEDLVCHYKDGQMIESCEGRVSLPLIDLHNGNVSLTLRDVRTSQRGTYICEVIHEYQTIKEYVFLHISSVDFSLVVSTGTVSADPGSDAILPVHLSPEISAVSMEIRWCRRTDLIYHYKNRREITTQSDYENRVSLSIQQLQRGTLSLPLRNVQQSDSGNYTCNVIYDGRQKTGVVNLQVREKENRKRESEMLKRNLRKMYRLHLSTSEKKKSIRIIREKQLRLQKRLSLHTSGATPKRRRRSSMDGHRPSMSTVRLNEYMQEEPSDTATHSGWEPVITLESESVLLSARDQTQAQEDPGETSTHEQESIATEQERSTPATQSQVQESETTSGSLTAGDTAQTPESPEDTTQSEVPKYGK